MSPPPRPPTDRSDLDAATESLAAATPGAARQPAEEGDHTGTAPSVHPPSVATDRTEWQGPPDREPAGDLDGTLVQRLSERLASEKIGRRMMAAGYKLLRTLGEGTYGQVWLAEEENTGVRVAIKFFAHGAGRQWQLLQDEVRQLAALDAAAGIVHLKDAVADADPPYYVMSYAEGGSLAQRLEKGPLPLPEALSLFRQIVQALAYVHAHGIRHCDLKPGNILLDRLGKPLVADFGQAHLSDDASPALGTFFYMAPEQADLAEQIPDTRWDVYGLGALFYAMLTGEPPRKDAALSGELANTVELGSRLRLYRQGVAATAKPTAHRKVRGMDRRLAAILDGCLALDPKERFPSAEAILEALERRQVRRRQRPLLALGMAAPLLAVSVIGALAWTTAQHQIEASEAALIRQTLDSDKGTAHLAANGFERGLQRRIEMLRNILDQDRAKDLARRLAGGGGAPARGVVDEDVRAVLDQASRGEGVGPMFNGLGVAGADGYIVTEIVKGDDGAWAVPADHEALWSQSFSWRDWFSGRGDRDRGQAYPPVAAPHISQPFLAKGLGRGVLFAVSVPVREPGGRVVGVLYGAIAWKDFTKWQENVTIENGQIITFNHRGQALKHQTGDGDDVEAAVRASPDGAAPAHAAALKGQLPNQEAPAATESFHDPFGKDDREFLAGYKYFDPNPDEEDRDGPLGVKWGVVVEHNRDQVLAPVAGLRQSMFAAGLWGVVGAGALTAGVWASLFWLLRREERLGHG